MGTSNLDLQGVQDLAGMTLKGIIRLVLRGLAREIAWRTSLFSQFEGRDADDRVVDEMVIEVFQRLRRELTRAQERFEAKRGIHSRGDQDGGAAAYDNGVSLN